jgi:site-specific DNA recombinase
VLAAELGAVATTPLRLHPNLAEVYRRKVADLQAALADPAAHAEALDILRGLIERVDVRAGDDGISIELVGAIANMLKLSAGAESLGKAPYVGSVKVVAGTRNRLCRTKLR